MQEQFDKIRRMWNNPVGTDEEALEWIIAHALALSARYRYCQAAQPAPEVTDE